MSDSTKNPFLAFEAFAKGFSGAWAEQAATTAKWSAGLAEEQMAFLRKQSAISAKCFQMAMTCRTPEDFAQLSIEAAKSQAELAFEQGELWLRMGEDLASGANVNIPGGKEAMERIGLAARKAQEGLAEAKALTMKSLDGASSQLKK